MNNPSTEKTNTKTIDRIGFLIHSLELINHFGCVLDLLPKGSFDIILHSVSLDFQSERLSKWGCNIISSDKVINSNLKYRYLVSNHPVSAGQHPLIKQLALYNIRFMYAAGKSGWNLAEWNNLYDIIMCFGPYHASKFTENTNAVVTQMGYPRFDEYFTGNPNLSELLTRYRCDPAKKTVVWLPTWKTLSSVGYFDEEISALMESYNVVVKLHPLMLESEPERVASLRQHNFTDLITDFSNNLPLYQIADFMLFDYGGPPLAGIYTDKKLILLNVPDAHKDKLTGENSPDVMIRKYIVNIGSDEKNISSLLSDDSYWETQKTPRHILRKFYFAPYFGFSAKVAAHTLLNLNLMVSEQVNIQ